MDHTEQRATVPVADVISQLLDLYSHVAKKSETLEQVFGNTEFLKDVEDKFAHLILDVAGVPKDGNAVPESFGSHPFVRDSYLDAPWGYLEGRLSKDEVVTMLVNWERFNDAAALWAKLDDHTE